MEMVAKPPKMGRHRQQPFRHSFHPIPWLEGVASCSPENPGQRRATTASILALRQYVHLDCREQRRRWKKRPGLWMRIHQLLMLMQLPKRQKLPLLLP